MEGTRIARLLTHSVLIVAAATSLANGRTLVPLAARDLTTANTLPSPWAYLGCYSDDTGSRTLTDGGYTSNNQMTGETCVSYCNSRGYIYAGVEYAAECFCGNRLRKAATKNVDSQCSMACNGDASQACGGPSRLTLYSNGKPEPPEPVVNPGPPGWRSMGCYEDGGARALSNGVGVQGDMTVGKCTAACKAQNFKYAGIEYAYECYCGNEILNSHGPATDGCTYLCQGNSTEYCGGPNRLNMYGPEVDSSSSTTQARTLSTVVDKPITDAPVPSQVSTTVQIATTPTGAVSTASPTSTGTAGGLPEGWSYAGCFVDGQNGRILTKGQPDSQTLTIESCITTCAGLGYSVAGMEYSTQCFCDNYVRNSAPLAAQDSECNMACSGNSTQKCGGAARTSVYGIAPVKVIQLPSVRTENLPGSYQYVGCLTDNVNGVRSLEYQSIYEQTNNATTCLSACMAYGYHGGGMEYGSECYCGDPQSIQAAATFVDESECNMPCPGDPEALCGNGNRLTFYEWKGPALYNWSYPEGAAAGIYQFLLYSPTVALITTLGINGKITLQEKFGTQYNGTGAYEFDPFYEDNYDKAWREMVGIQTDIFCAAGLVLPDKAGRQVTFGGWSGDSTMGIRLYTPDGQPGTPGVNDWEENRLALQLQVGRWYPSAMQMANGSILVVGGEVGSNGAPVPNLEVVPKVGPLVYQDWLARTDPYNLYPFLAVLPSGGIFVAYYNEARILDEGSLTTSRTLPNIPGSVNNPLGGRTYPLEGSLMILPQHAPYTDPLGVLICGGSTPGYPVPLDNCVSTQPELADPKWIIERMPSRRVLSCMTALPDGTYLILNGAHFGVAGFGLARDPNFNAVLYDPTKPVGSRMSVMANTTIPRLYHSESLLMPDGRVLVTGSNPNDDGKGTDNEYRVEVFLPPYLTSGLARPTFTLSARDVAYGGTFTVTLTSGSTANLRVSLMGAESNTHGATMGQRTFFPAVSCAGMSCTVTAPPNARVCPPGWFQVFVLDGPTPSRSQFIRIGGDPAGLGNWPQVDGFTLPGV